MFVAHIEAEQAEITAIGKTEKLNTYVLTDESSQLGQNRIETYVHSAVFLRHIGIEKIRLV